MNQYFIISIIVSDLIALYLLIKVWKSDERILLKIIGTIIGLIPFIGLLAIMFVFDMPENQPSNQQNQGPRGELTHAWISSRNKLKKAIKEKQKENESKT